MAFERVCGLGIPGAGQGGQARGGQGGLLDGGPRVFLQVAQQPTGGYPRMAGGVFASNQQGEVEGVE